ncbi:MAG: GNAT family N-acetyltransferase [Acidimicrobiales bacterium]
MTDDEPEVDATFTAVERATSMAVGMLGVKGSLRADGSLEIGYGFGRESWGRGLATEAVTALSAHLLARSEVRAIFAETAVWNRASERVLEKAGFVRFGVDWDEEDGDLVVWRVLA